MKNIKLILLSFIFVSICHAGVSDVKPSKVTISPAVVEKVITLQNETNEKPAIRIVLVDNGGSTDISSAMYPSKPYLVFHKDGEEFNVYGAYVIADGITSIISTSYLKDKKTVLLSFNYKDEHLKTKQQSLSIDISDVLTEIQNATSEEFVDYSLKSSIGLKIQQ